jgi:DNA invertase Pin-like site-specific DNA recombinase
MTTKSTAKAAVKAFGYLRVSGKGQIEGDGFTRQEKAIREYANANGIRIVSVFREEGVSGTTDLENRPALAAMIEALHGNGVRLVLVEKLDRLARDLMVQETILGDLRKHEFELVSVHEPDLCQTDPTRTLMRQLMGAIAQYEKSMIVLKLRGARERQKVRTGRCEGRKPFGFHPSERRTLERMKALRSEGVSFDRLARQLTVEGFLTRKGTAWDGKTVNRILTRLERRKEASPSH